MCCMEIDKEKLPFISILKILCSISSIYHSLVLRVEQHALCHVRCLQIVDTLNAQ